MLLEAGGAPPIRKSSEEDTREVLNYIQAMQHGLKRLDDLPISLRLIREIHEKLLQGVRGDEEAPGAFRRAQNFIGKRGDGPREARFVPPPVPEMTIALDDLEKAMDEQLQKQTVPLLLHLAAVHYQFETIHPFADGNGRVGRLLIPLLLYAHDRIREPVLYLSSFFEKNRQEYYDLMLRVGQRGDWQQWLNFFLSGVEQSALEAIEQANGLLELRERYHQKFHSARSSVLLLKLIDELFRRPSITIGKAASLLKVTQAAASANLKKLEKAGIIEERTGRKRDQQFVAMDIVAFMDRPAKLGARAEQRELPLGPKRRD